MALQFSVAVRNNRLDSIENTVGASAIIMIRTGPPPLNCAAANSGSVLVSMNLPSDYLTNASGGVKVKSGTWSAIASGTGVAGHWRMYASDGTTTHMQGDVTVTGAGGVMTVDSINITLGQSVVVTGFSITDGNA